MMFRPPHILVVVLPLMVAACSDSDNFVQVANTATVRLVNDTDTPISLIGATVPDSAGSTLTFGQATGCALVELSEPIIPRLIIRNGVTGASLALTSFLSAGGDLTVIAFDGAAGTLQLATLDNRFAPSGGFDAGLRFFDGASSVGPLFMERNGDLTPLVGLGAASPFVSVSTDSTTIQVANPGSIVLGESATAAPFGRNSTVVVGPPAPGTIPLRVFTVQNCVGNEA